MPLRGIDSAQLQYAIRLPLRMEPTNPDDRRISSTDAQNPVDSLWYGLESANIPGLDGIRALAVLAVFFFHLGFENFPGGQAVLAFFVLSGFLITWLLLREWRRFGRIDLWKFYARRSLRIFPAFYCYLLVSLASLLIMRKSVPWAQFAASSVYLTNYYHAIHGHLTSLFAHTWSLSVEEQFYLLWPVTLMALMGRPDRLASRLGWGISLVTLWRLVGRFWIGLPEYHAYETLDMRADHLLIGCLLAVLLDQRRGLSFWKFVTKREWYPLIPIALLVASDRLQSRGVEWRDSLGFMIDPWLFAILIVQWITWSRHGMWSWLNSRLVTTIGRLAYSIYLFHPLAIGVAEKLLPKNPVIHTLGSSVIVLIVAGLSHLLIEMPFLKWKSKFQAHPPIQNSPQ